MSEDILCFSDSWLSDKLLQYNFHINFYQKSNEQTHENIFLSHLLRNMCANNGIKIITWNTCLDTTWHWLKACVTIALWMFPTMPSSAVKCIRQCQNCHHARGNSQIPWCYVMEYFWPNWSIATIKNVNNLTTTFLYICYILHSKNVGLSSEYRTVCSYCYCNQLIVYIMK